MPMKTVLQEEPFRYRFLNANTVESFTTNRYIGHKSGAFHTETISGKTVSFVAENVRTYTYVLDGNKVYITDGASRYVR